MVTRARRQRRGLEKFAASGTGRRPQRGSGAVLELALLGSHLTQEPKSEANSAERLSDRHLNEQQANRA